MTQLALLRPEQTMMTCSVAAAFLLAAFALLVAWMLSGHQPGGGACVLGIPVLTAAYCFLFPESNGVFILICSTMVMMMIMRRMMKTKLLKPEGAVLITGCDSGFGHALALRLSGMGMTVFAGVLDVNGDGAKHLHTRAAENLQVLQLDVTDDAQVEKARQHICAQVGRAGLWALVNNAGTFPCPADAELLPLSSYRCCMDVNFLSAVRMCQVFLPMLRRSRGRIVNVSSLAADVHFPLMAAYGASKAALNNFSRSLRVELSQWGVQVVVIQPTGFKTNLFGSSDDITNLKAKLLASVSSEAAEDYGEAYITSLPDYLRSMSKAMAQDLSPVLDALCDALLSARPRHLYMPGQMGNLLPFLCRHLPTAIFDLISPRLVSYRHVDAAAATSTEVS